MVNNIAAVGPVQALDQRADAGVAVSVGLCAAAPREAQLKQLASCEIDAITLHLTAKQCPHSVGAIKRQKNTLIKALLLLSLTFTSVLLSIYSGGAADQTGVAAELDSLVARVQTKLRQGKRTQAELAPELKQFDLLFARNKGEQTDALANVLVEEASLYLQVLQNFQKARELVEQLKRDFPRTKAGQGADKMLDSISKHEEAKRLEGIFVVGSLLPDFEEKDLAYKPLSIGQYRGKVVLLDFGATWSKAWIDETPNLRRLYESYHRRGFEIIGVSLDQDQLRLSGFTTRNQLPWPQFCDGSGWNNKLAIKYGITSLPANFLLDGEGKIVARNLRAQELEHALAKAMSRRTPQ